MPYYCTEEELALQLACPRCGAKELANPDAPKDKQYLNIRAFKVEQGGYWWSQCLVCANVGHKDKGWFK